LPPRLSFRLARGDALGLALGVTIDPLVRLPKLGAVMRYRITAGAGHESRHGGLVNLAGVGDPLLSPAAPA
jgi:hypothetical protein